MGAALPLISLDIVLLPQFLSGVRIHHKVFKAQFGTSILGSWPMLIERDRRCQLYWTGLASVHRMLSMTSEHIKAKIIDLLIDDEES